MEGNTKNIIEKRIDQDECDKSIKSFLNDLLMEENCHSKQDRWNYKSFYSKALNKYRNFKMKHED